MASLYTDIGAVQAGGVNVLADLVDPNLSAARLKLITATYTMTGDEIANDVIYIAKIPSGSLVDTPAGNVATAGCASTCTITVGDTDTVAATVTPDAARYSSTLTIGAGNSTVGFPFTGGTTLNAPAKVTDDWVFITAKLATLTTPTEGATIVFRIPVSMLD